MLTVTLKRIELDDLGLPTQLQKPSHAVLSYFDLIISTPTVSNRIHYNPSKSQFWLLYIEFFLKFLSINHHDVLCCAKSISEIADIFEIFEKKFYTAVDF